MRNPIATHRHGNLRQLVARAVALLIAGMLGSAPLHAQQTMRADSAAVVEVIEQYHTALASGDTVTAMGLLAPGAVILESGGKETREEYRSHHLPADIAFAQAVARERGPIEVSIHGEVAWAASTSTTRGTFRDREVNAQGAELMVLRRTDAGWRIEAIHWSSRNLRS